MATLELLYKFTAQVVKIFFETAISRLFQQPDLYKRVAKRQLLEVQHTFRHTRKKTWSLFCAFIIQFQKNLLKQKKLAPLFYF